MLEILKMGVIVFGIVIGITCLIPIIIIMGSLADEFFKSIEKKYGAWFSWLLYFLSLFVVCCLCAIPFHK